MLCPLTRLRRPLSSIPKSRQLRAATAALEDMLSSSPPRSAGSARPQGGGKQLLAPERRGVRSLNMQPLTEVDSFGPGFLLGGRKKDPDGMGRYNSIYPGDNLLRSDRTRFLKIMATASDLFPDQRCGCAWCAR